MKLIFCPECHDVFKLHKSYRCCLCSKSWGRYLDDGINAEISGKGIPIGFSNSSFASALKNRPKNGLGEKFEAFVISQNCNYIKKEK